MWLSERWETSWTDFPRRLLSTVHCKWSTNLKSFYVEKKQYIHLHLFPEAVSINSHCGCFLQTSLIFIFAPDKNIANTCIRLLLILCQYLKQYGKCIEMSTNRPMFVPVVLEICDIFISQVSGSQFCSCKVEHEGEGERNKLLLTGRNNFLLTHSVSIV